MTSITLNNIGFEATTIVASEPDRWKFHISKNGMHITGDKGLNPKQLQDLMDRLEKKLDLMILCIRQYTPGLLNKRHPLFQYAVEVDVLDSISKERKTLIYSLDEIKDLQKEPIIPDMRDWKSDMDFFFEE